MNTIQSIYKEIEFAFKSKQKSIKESTILFLGISHKFGLEHIHEPLVIDIMKMVSEKGADVSYSDSFIKEIKLNGQITFVEEGKEKNLFSLTRTMESVPLTAENLGNFDCVVITTNCSYNLAFIKEYSKFTIDLRNRIKNT